MYFLAADKFSNWQIIGLAMKGKLIEFFHLDLYTTTKQEGKRSEVHIQADLASGRQFFLGLEWGTRKAVLR